MTASGWTTEIATAARAGGDPDANEGIAVRRTLAEITNSFGAAADVPGLGVHSLFAHLYLRTTERWLADLGENDDTEMTHRVIWHFYRLYDLHVLDELQGKYESDAYWWRLYHRLARRITMRSPIAVQLVLLTFGARAHIHHDLGVAVSLAAQDCGRRLGRQPDLDRMARGFIGSRADRVFGGVADDFIEIHLDRQSGWRRGVLTGYLVALRLVRPLWLRVLHSWRRAAYAEASRRLQADRIAG